MSIYEMIIGKVQDKRFQTIEIGDDAGSILYFEFETKSQNAKEFIKELIWRGDIPKIEHQEEIITHDKATF